MKKKILVGLSITLLMCMILVNLVSAQQHFFTLSWSVIGSGGMGGSAGDFTILSTLGQPVTGSLSSGPFNLISGFWTDIRTLVTWIRLFLPMILR